jgi:hypothetical protein
MPTAFLLLRGLTSAYDLDLCTPGAQSPARAKSHSNACGTSCDPGCGTLLLYSQARLFELFF